MVAIRWVVCVPIWRALEKSCFGSFFYLFFFSIDCDDIPEYDATAAEGLARGSSFFYDVLNASDDSSSRNHFFFHQPFFWYRIVPRAAWK